MFLLYLFYTMKSVTLMADDFRYSMRSSFNSILPQERITSIWQILQTTIYDYLYMGARYATVIITCFVLMFGASLYKFVGPIIVLQVILFHRVFLSDKSEKINYYCQEL